MFRLTSAQCVLLITTIYLGACLGQTFQYSRGWTNGKRSQAIVDTFNQQRHIPRYLQKDENGISSELYDDDRWPERCLLHMRNLLGRTALYSSVLSPKPTPKNSNSNSHPDSSNNNLLGSHHQSTELFDELNGVIDANDYGKH